MKKSKRVLSGVLVALVLVCSLCNTTQFASGGGQAGTFALGEELIGTY